MEFHGRTSALLPTGTRMNPRKPATAEYYDPKQTILIVNICTYPGIKPKYRCLTTFGGGDGWEIDTVHDIHHDQTGRYLSRDAKVVGLVDEGGTYGLVPNRPLPHWVFK